MFTNLKFGKNTVGYYLICVPILCTNLCTNSPTSLY